MTTTPQFDVWFDGKLAAGTDATAVCQELMTVFGINESQALTLLNGNSHRIKKGCDQAMANRLLEQFRTFGAQLRLEQIDTGLNIAPSGSLLLEGFESPPPASVPTPEWELAPAGDIIPGLDLMQDIPPINTDHLSVIDH
jgi:hypothetical protein